MKRLGATLLLCFLLTGCAAYKIHPGAVNGFDSGAYDSLIVAHATIESTKADLAGNAFPASVTPAVKKAVNDLIAAYNIADTAYLDYHAAAAAGTVTQAQIDAVSNGLTNVSTALTNLSSAKGVVKGAKK